MPEAQNGSGPDERDGDDSGEMNDEENGGCRVGVGARHLHAKRVRAGDHYRGGHHVVLPNGQPPCAERSFGHARIGSD
jgi:hypothetical protein